MSPCVPCGTFLLCLLLCRCACCPGHRCPDLLPAGGAGLRPDVRLPHHLQSSLRRWRQRHEGGPRVWGEPVSCCCKQPLLCEMQFSSLSQRHKSYPDSCLVEMEQSKRHGHLPLWQVFLYSLNVLFALSQRFDITTWSFISLVANHAVIFHIVVWNCLCQLERPLKGSERLIPHRRSGTLRTCQSIFGPWLRHNYLNRLQCEDDCKTHPHAARVCLTNTESKANTWLGGEKLLGHLPSLRLWHSPANRKFAVTLTNNRLSVACRSNLFYCVRYLPPAIP